MVDILFIYFSCPPIKNFLKDKLDFVNNDIIYLFIYFCLEMKENVLLSV